LGGGLSGFPWILVAEGNIRALRERLRDADRDAERERERRGERERERDEQRGRPPKNGSA